MKDLLSESELELTTAVTRKKLIPWWIRVFAWIFLVMGGMAILCMGISLFADSLALAIYSLETDQLFSLTGLAIFTIYLLKGITSYGLLWQKDWAVQLAMVDAVAGIIICFATMFFPVNNSSGNINFRLEILLLFPYLIRMIKIKDDWKAAL